MARIIEGHFEGVDGILELLQGPEWSFEVLRAVREQLERVDKDEISQQEALEEIKKLSPVAASAVASWFGGGVGVAAMLLAIFLHLDNKKIAQSSSEQMDEMIAAQHKIVAHLETILEPETIDAPSPADTTSKDTKADSTTDDDPAAPSSSLRPQARKD